MTKSMANCRCHHRRCCCHVCNKFHGLLTIICSIRSCGNLPVATIVLFIGLTKTVKQIGIPMSRIPSHGPWVYLVKKNGTFKLKNCQEWQRKQQILMVAVRKTLKSLVAHFFNKQVNWFWCLTHENIKLSIVNEKLCLRTAIGLHGHNSRSHQTGDLLLGRMEKLRKETDPLTEPPRQPTRGRGNSNNINARPSNLQRTKSLPSVWVLQQLQQEADAAALQSPISHNHHHHNDDILVSPRSFVHFGQ